MVGYTFAILVHDSHVITINFPSVLVTNHIAEYNDTLLIILLSQHYIYIVIKLNPQFSAWCFRFNRHMLNIMFTFH